MIYRIRVAALILAVSAVFTCILVLELGRNSSLHHEFKTPLAARVIHTSSKWETNEGFLGLGGFGYPKHTKDEIEVITLNGVKWFYKDVPMSADVRKGQGVRVWVANNDMEHGAAIFEREYVKNPDGEEKVVNTPFKSFLGILGLALMMSLVASMVLIFIFGVALPKSRRSHGNGNSRPATV